MHCPSEIFKKVLAVTHLTDQGIKSLNTFSAAKIHDRSRLRQSPFELHHLARHDLAGRRTGNDSLKVTYVADHCLETSQLIIVVREILDNRVSALKFLKVHHRHGKPCPEHTGTHRR